MKTKIVLMTFVLFYFFNYSLMASPPDTKNIEGAWQVVSFQQFLNGSVQTLIPSATNNSEMKIWTKDYFAFVGKYGDEKNSSLSSGGGTYKLDGNKYVETLKYHPDKRYLEAPVQLRMEFKNDTIIQIWPVNSSGEYNKSNCNIVKLVRFK